MQELLDALEQYAACLVPLRSSTRGAIFVSLGQPPGFDDTALRIVQAVARQASNLIDHARTFQKVQHAARVHAGLAVLAIYHPTPRPLIGEERALIEAAAHLAGIAIERKRAERELAKVRDQALAAARLKSEFVANMSHEPVRQRRL